VRRPRPPHPAPGPLSAWAWIIAATQVAVLLATSTRYGYHRDEMYFIAAGSHAALGYPDQPPLVPLLAWAMHTVAPDSLLLLRTPSALVAGVTTLLATSIAREVGGSARAQVVAAACTASCGFALAVSHIVSTTTFDLLSTTLLCWLAVRALARGDGFALLACGMVVGIGIEAKPQVGLVALAMVGAVAAVGPRYVLRSRWALGGALAAVALAAPYLIWQQQHGWPQARVAEHIAGTEEGGRAGFVPFQLVMVGPLLTPIWLAGLIAPFRRPGWGALRFLSVTYAALALIYIAGDGKAYYLASLYPALLGLGAVPAAEWTLRARARTSALAAAVAVSAVVSAVIALPLLPERDLRGSIAVALNPTQGETVGWPRFARTVAAAWRLVPAPERPRTAVFTANYGEAGAIDLLGARLGVPRAYSGHNGFGEWGMPPPADTSVLLVGFKAPAEAAPYFTACRALATVDNGVGLDNQEQGLPVMLCRASTAWPAMWPHLRHYD
jgi:4-amino-4-deoxy-L-arabinose transferase-like glycosyltransferase